MTGLTDKAPALGIIAERSELAARLETLGYANDPVLGCFTGISLAPLDDGAEPSVKPRFTGRNAISLLIGESEPSDKPVIAKVPPTVSLIMPERLPRGGLYGIDWSGARAAGDKIWVAALDPARRTVVGVTRPWKGLGPEDAARNVADWMGALPDAWIGIDAPFGLAADDQQALIGSVEGDPGRWSRGMVERYPDRHDFIAAVAERELIGRHRRVTDKHCRSPFAPTLLQMIHQTYAALQMLSRLDRKRVRILPWDNDRAANVTLIETCPAVLLKALGLSNHGYKLRPGSDIRRRAILDEISERLGWQVDDAVARLVEQDREGDVLDAILCGMATARSTVVDHAALAGEDRILEEGWIYA